MVLSKELILSGSKFRKTIKVTAYDDDVEIKPLTDVEIAKIFKKVEDAGFSTEDPKLSDNYLMQVEACRFGLVDKSLHEIVNPEDEEKDQKEVFELMIGNALAEIGREIISISSVANEELNDFFRLQKGSN